MFKKRRKKRKFDYDASVSLIDSKNLANFDQDKFEGVLEQPIEKKNFILLFVVFLLLIFVFSVKAFYMQIINGDEYLKQAKANYLKSAVIFSERGVIMDRNGKELAWNEKDINTDFPKRKYIDKLGFSHILGFLSYPQTDEKGRYYEKEYQGKAGAEKYFNNELNGKLGKRILEVDAFGNIISDNVVEKPEPGVNINLSIDADVQEKMAIHLQNFMNKYNFKGGAGVLMNVRNGQVIAMVSLPEYKSQILTDGEDKEQIKKCIFDKNTPFLNRVTLGAFAPGSTVKPFTALKALQDKIVSPYKKFYTNGKLVLPNPYHPDKPSIFSDYHNYGAIDMRKAIIVSSNIYFHIMGGGFKDQKGLGIDRLYKNFHNFGFGEKTGIEKIKEQSALVPNPEWKQKTFNKKWNIGNTYFTAIGQYSFLATPMQLAVAVSAIANNGEVLKPKILKNSKKEVKRKINFDKKNWDFVKSAMRGVVTDPRGTGRLLNAPELKSLKIAAKTGTAQRGIGKSEINSLSIGFFPYDNPKYAFVFLAERGSAKRIHVVSYAARQFFLDLKKTKILDRLMKE